MEIIIGQTYWYNNQPVIALREEEGGNFYLVEAALSAAHGIEASDFCAGCQIGDSDNKLSCTCSEHYALIEDIDNELKESFVLYAHRKELKEKPIEKGIFDSLLRRCKWQQDKLDKLEASEKEVRALINQKDKIKREFEQEMKEMQAAKKAAEDSIGRLNREIKDLEEEKQDVITEKAIKIKGGGSISIDDLLELLQADVELSALQRGGLDNWEWYGESLENVDIEKEALERLKNML